MTRYRRRRRRCGPTVRPHGGDDRAAPRDQTGRQLTDGPRVPKRPNFRFKVPNQGPAAAQDRRALRGRLRGDDPPGASGGAARPDRQGGRRGRRRLHRRHFPGRPLLDWIVESARVETAEGGVGGLDIQSPTDPITIYFKIALYVAIGFAMPVIRLPVDRVPGARTDARKRSASSFGRCRSCRSSSSPASAYAFFFAVASGVSRFSRSWQTSSSSWAPGQRRGHQLLPDVDDRSWRRLPVAGDHVPAGQAQRGQPEKDASYRKYAFLVILSSRRSSPRAPTRSTWRSSRCRWSSSTRSASSSLAVFRPAERARGAESCRRLSP